MSRLTVHIIDLGAAANVGAARYNLPSGPVIAIQEHFVLSGDPAVYRVDEVKPLTWGGCSGDELGGELVVRLWRTGHEHGAAGSERIVVVVVVVADVDVSEREVDGAGRPRVS